MYSCWNEHSNLRPLFGNLEQTIYKLLDENVAEHYVVLNDLYVKCNAIPFSNGNTDYLAMMASPDCLAPSIPSDDDNNDFNVPHMTQSNIVNDEPNMENSLYFITEQNTALPSTSNTSVGNDRSSNENVQLQTFNPLNQSEQNVVIDAKTTIT